jgi:hypothetical protein
VARTRKDNLLDSLQDGKRVISRTRKWLPKRTPLRRRTLDFYNRNSRQPCLIIEQMIHQSVAQFARLFRGKFQLIIRDSHANRFIQTFPF